MTWRCPKHGPNPGAKPTGCPIRPPKCQFPHCHRELEQSYEKMAAK